MKTIKIFFITTILFTLSANSQITKGNWLVGGNASFSYSKYENAEGTDNNQGNYLTITPNLGYFIKNNFVTGLQLSFSHSHRNGNTSTGFDYGGGPFVRYYFMKPEKLVNFLLEANYSYYTGSKANSFNNNYGFKTGPVIFFNSNVGLEILASYNSSFISSGGYDLKEIKFGFGLQIHLEK